MTQGGDTRQHADGVDALKVAAGAATDSELAGLLGLQRSAVAQWRRRGRVPEKAALKVSFLRFAREDEAAARRLLSGTSADVILYARALAIVATAAGNPGRVDRDALDAESERLRKESFEFDRACAAAARLVESTMKQFNEGAWEAYRRLLTYGYLRHDVRETLMKDIAAIRATLPQSSGLAD